jgi:tRNA 2-thiouridine synthesizing protein E
MAYTINGEEKECDANGFLLEADLTEDAVHVIAEHDGIELTDDHWKIITYLRDKYMTDGHTPNMRNLIKGLQDEGVMPEADSKLLFDLFPDGGAAKQGCRIAGLPQPIGKGGY